MTRTTKHSSRRQTRRAALPRLSASVMHKPNTTLNRYLLGLILGFGVAFVVWIVLLNVTPGAGTMSLKGLVPVFGAGLVGGIVAAVVAPSHKSVVAITLGFIVGGSLVAAIMLSRHFPLGGRNPLFWYWPMWFIPAFACGGFIGQRLTVMSRKINHSLMEKVRV